MTLFKQINFVSAACLYLTWKIECDALTDADWQTIATASAHRLPKFHRVVGVPRGGLKLARALERYSTRDADLTLVVDDVWTTGKSMTAHARAHVDGEWRGFVAFSRGDLPSHVTCFAQILPRPAPATASKPGPSDLVERLRQPSHINPSSGYAYYDPVRAEAATALEAKEAEIAALRERVELNPSPQDYLKMSRMWAEEKARVETAERKLAEARAALTPSAETKAAYIGEFHFEIEDHDEGGEECSRKVTVPWTTIKEIMATIHARALKPTEGKK